jgi:hypothetical protein
LLAVEEGASLKLKQDPEDFNIVSFFWKFLALPMDTLKMGRGQTFQDCRLEILEGP